MTTNRTTDDQLVGRYMEDLRAESTVLEADKRAELLGQIEAHFNDARSDNVDIRSSIDRLGRPEELVSEALRQGSFTPQPRQPSQASIVLWAVGLVVAVLWAAIAAATLIGAAVVGAGQGWMLFAASVLLLIGLALSIWTARGFRRNRRH
jgi:uncharacterized membrane protein